MDDAEAPGGAAAPAWSAGARKVLRAIHLIVNALWLGGATATLLLLLAGSPRKILAATWTHDQIVVWAALAVLCTGLLFSLYTPWGFFRRWWIVGKWVGLALLGATIPFVAGPRLARLAAAADLELATGVTVPPTILGTAIGWATAEVVLLAGVFGLSTWRPPRRTGVDWHPARRLRTVILVVAVSILAMAGAQSAVLERARRTALPVTTANGLPDGARRATVDWLGAPVEVELVVRDQRISFLRVLRQRSGLYGELAAQVAAKVAQTGDLDVDGVSGATTSSRGILLAAARALERP